MLKRKLFLISESRQESILQALMGGESRMMGNYHVRFGKGVKTIHPLSSKLFRRVTFTLVHYNPSVLEAFNSVEHSTIRLFYLSV